MTPIDRSLRDTVISFKRLVDIVFSIIGLLLFSPILLITSALIRINLGTPILYKQIRPGFRGKPFRLYKFRTMTDEKDHDGNFLPDADRLTGFGRFLRAASVDELPELLNILKGEMSLVGPRPLLMRYLDRYTPEQARRHEVKPGLTGWTQVNGRNALSWEEKFQLDVWYVDHRTFWLDIKIILMTIRQVLKRDGISHSGEATMPEFMGTGTEGR